MKKYTYLLALFISICAIVPSHAMVFRNAFKATQIPTTTNIKKQKPTKTSNKSYAYKAHPAKHTIKSSNLSSLIGNYFSRKHNITQILCNVIKNTKQTIDGAIYVFTCKKLYKELVQAFKNGVKMRFIFDKKQAQQKYSLVKDLIENTDAHVYVPKDNYALMHCKYSIHDEKVLTNGSFNWTKAAGGGNHWKKGSKKINCEHIRITNNSSDVQDFMQNFEETLSECDRIEQWNDMYRD